MKTKFAIVCSTFNEPYVGALLDHALAGLAPHVCDVVRVPGSYEIPLQVQRLAKTRKYAAVLALGLVWQGKTLHATEILRAVTEALMRISRKYDVPVIHEVLAIRTEAEAKQRTMGDKLNRGAEAAEAALAVVSIKPQRVKRAAKKPKVSTAKPARSKARHRSGSNSAN